MEYWCQADWSGPLADLNSAQINWSHEPPLNCNRCRCLSQWPPTAGSYASSLIHFEQAMGARLPEPRSKLRLLMLFLDPRPIESNFTAIPPAKSPAGLSSDRHRYFCLTQAAWDSLGLVHRVGSDRPCWPTDETSFHFLRKYLRGGNGWSYDAFVAYLLFRLRPLDAYVTNLSKCYLSQRSEEAMRICGHAHLRRELEMTGANCVLSFTAKIKDRQALSQFVGSVPVNVECVMYLYHFAAHLNQDARTIQWRRQIERNREVLTRLGCQSDELVNSWLIDQQRLNTL